jgi:hypothetical protein
MPMLTPNEKIAKEISCYLSAFEHSANANRRDSDGRGMFYGASAVAKGARIGIIYISFQHRTWMTAGEAQKYLSWLQAGWVGTHHAMEQGGGVKMEVQPYVKPKNEPTLESRGGNGDYYVHPSWGVIQVARTTGSRTLFGSNIEHGHFITLRIGTAYKHLSESGHETISGSSNRQIVEVSMSEAQWAALLSSMNMGSGVPCTLESVNSETLPDCPDDQVRERFHQLIESDVTKLSERLRMMEEEIATRFEDKKPLTQAEKREILGQMSSVLQELRSNMPYVQKVFEEKLEEQVEGAKAEIDGFIAFKAQMLGAEALKEKFAALSQGMTVDSKSLPAGQKEE